MQSWKSNRDKLAKLIKKVSQQNGGDDPVWLAEYTQQVINDYTWNLNVPIDCFISLSTQLCHNG